MATFRFAVSILAAAILTAMASDALAADQSDLMGRWAERFPNGAAMIVMFSPTAISMFAETKDYQVKPIGQPQAVTYKAFEDGINVEFQGGGGIVVILKDHDHASMLFPGMGSHNLTRQ